MKTFRIARGPFLERPYYKDEEVERICTDELRAVGLLPTSPSPVRIERFIEKKYGMSPCYEALPKGVLGLTQFTSSGPNKIVISEELEQQGGLVAERRIRSTLAHEAGHCMLHTHLFAFSSGTPLFGDVSDPNTPKVLCRDPDSYSGEWWEFQANQAMSVLLLPSELVYEGMQRFLRPAGLLGIPMLHSSERHAATRAISELFDVNPIMARIRVEKLFPEHGMQML